MEAWWRVRGVLCCARWVVAASVGMTDLVCVGMAELGRAGEVERLCDNLRGVSAGARCALCALIGLMV